MTTPVTTPVTMPVTRRVTAPAWRTGAAWLAGGLLVWALLLTWALGIGRYGGPDEPAHVIRAAAVADGQVRGAPASGMAGGFRVVRVPAALAAGDPACYRHDPTVPAGCSAVPAPGGTATVATSAGINPPLYYAMVGLPVRWLGRSGDTTWYRVVATGWNAAVLLLAAWRLRGDALRVRGGALVVVALVTPATWFLLGVVNPNGLEVALALLAWIGVHRLTAGIGHERGPTPGDCRWVSLPAAAMVAVRPIGVMALAAMALVVIVRTRATSGWRWRSRAWLVAPPALAGVLVAVWQSWVRLEFDDPRTADPRGFGRILVDAVGGTGATLSEVVGSASWLEYTMPPVSHVVWWLVAGALLVTGMRRGSPRDRAAIAVWAAVLLGGPVAFEVAVADRVGLIWQGRYSIPTLLGLVLLGLSVRVPARWRGVLATCLALSSVAAYWLTVRRYTVGVGGGWSSWWFEPAPGAGRSWEPVLPAPALLAAHVSLVAGLVAGLVASTVGVVPFARRPSACRTADEPPSVR